MCLGSDVLMIAEWAVVQKGYRISCPAQNLYCEERMLSMIYQEMSMDILQVVKGVLNSNDQYNIN